MAGRITATTATEFEHRLQCEIECCEKCILLNLSDVTLLTSIGIRILLKTHKKLAEEGGKLQIEEPSQAVSGVLGLSALQQLLVV